MSGTAVHGLEYEQAKIFSYLRALAKPRQLNEPIHQSSRIILLESPDESGSVLLEREIATYSKTLLLTTLSTSGQKSSRCIPMRPIHDILVELLNLKSSRANSSLDKHCCYMYNSPAPRRKSLWQVSTDEEISERDRLPVQIRVAATSNSASSFIQKLLPGWGDFDTARQQETSISQDDLLELLSRNEMIRILTSLLQSAAHKAPLVLIFSNIHFFDSCSLALLLSLCEEIRPAVFIISFNPNFLETPSHWMKSKGFPFLEMYGRESHDRISEWVRKVRSMNLATYISLPPYSYKAIEIVVRKIADEKKIDISEQFLKQISQESHGNIYYANIVMDIIHLKKTEGSLDDQIIPKNLPSAARELINLLTDNQKLILYIISSLGVEFNQGQVEDILLMLHKDDFQSLQGVDVPALVQSTFNALCSKFHIIQPTITMGSVVVEPPVYASTISPSVLAPTGRSNSLIDSPQRSNSLLAVPNRAPSITISSEPPSLMHQNSIQSTLGIPIAIPPKPLTRRQSSRKRMSQVMMNITGDKSSSSSSFTFTNEVFRDVALLMITGEDGIKVDQATMDHITTYHYGGRSCWYFHSQDALNLSVRLGDGNQAKHVISKMVDFLGSSTLGSMREYAWWLEQHIQIDLEEGDDKLVQAQHGRWLAEAMCEIGYGHKEDSFSGLTKAFEILRTPMISDSIIFKAKFPFLLAKHFTNWALYSRYFLDNPQQQYPIDIHFPTPADKSIVLSRREIETYEYIMMLDRQNDCLLSLEENTSQARLNLLIESINKAEGFQQPTGLLARHYAQFAAEMHRQGHRRTARRFFRLSTVISKRCGDLTALLYCFCLLGSAAIEVANWSALQDSLETSMALYGKNGITSTTVRFVSPLHERTARLSIAVASEYRGKLDSAIEFYEDLYDMASNWRTKRQHTRAHSNDDTHLDLPPERSICLVWGYAGKSTVLLIRGQIAEPIRLLSAALIHVEKHAQALRYEYLRVCAPLAVAKIRAGHPTDEAIELISKIQLEDLDEIMESPSGYSLMNSFGYLVEAYLDIWNKTSDKGDIGRRAYLVLKKLARYGEMYPVALPHALYWNAKYNFLSGRKLEALDSWKLCVEKARFCGTPLSEGLAALELALNYSNRQLRRGTEDNTDLKHGVSASIHFLQTAARIFSQLNIPQLERLAQVALDKRFEETLHGTMSWSPKVQSNPQIINSPVAMNMSTSADVDGRDKQVNLVKKALQNLNENPVKPKVIILEGDQGMGKSVIARELKHSCDVLEIPTLISFCDFRDQRCPFYSWRPIILATLGLDPNSMDIPEAHLKTKLLDLMKSIDQSSIYACLFNSLLATDFAENESISSMSSTAKQEKLLDLIFRFIMKAFSSPPDSPNRVRVIILEDVHIMSESSWSVLLKILQAVSYIPFAASMTTVSRFVSYNLPVMFLLTARRVGEPQTGYQILEQLADVDMNPFNRLFFIRLSPISEQQTKNILLSHFGSVAEDVISYTHQTSSGNPLFVREIIKHLLSTKSIHQFPSGQWHLIQTPSTLPDVLKAALSERLDSLSSSQRNILGFCAVFQSAVNSLQVGTTTVESISIEFSTPLRFLIRAYDHDDGDQDEYVQQEDANEQYATVMESITPDLKKLIYLGLISEATSTLMVDQSSGTSEPEISYYLGHPLIRDWCYKMLNQGERVRTHRLAGRWLEDAPSESIAMDYASFIAYHFERADETQRALFYLELAASRFFKRGLYREMANAMSGSLDIGDQQQAQDQLRRSLWEIGFAHACLGLGHLSRSCRHVNSALSILGLQLSSTFRTSAMITRWSLRQTILGSMPTRYPVVLSSNGSYDWSLFSPSLKQVHPEFAANIFRSKNLTPSLIVIQALYVLGQARKYRNQYEEYLFSCIAQMNIMYQKVGHLSSSELGCEIPVDVRNRIESDMKNALSVFGIDSYIVLPPEDLDSPGKVLMQLSLAENMIGKARFEKSLEILRYALHGCESMRLDQYWDFGMLLLGVTHRFLGNFPAALRVFEELSIKIRNVGTSHNEKCAVLGLIDSLLWTGGLGAASPHLQYLDEDPDNDDFHTTLLQISVSSLVAFRADDQGQSFQKIVQASELIERHSSSRWTSLIPIRSLSILAECTAALLEMEAMAHRMRPGDLDETRYKALRKLLKFFVSKIASVADCFPAAKSTFLIWKGVSKWSEMHEEAARSCWMEAIQEATRNQIMADLAMAHYEFGRRSMPGSEIRTEHLSKSVRLFSEMKAGFWATRAQQDVTAVPFRLHN